MTQFHYVGTIKFEPTSPAHAPTSHEPDYRQRFTFIHVMQPVGRRRLICGRVVSLYTDKDVMSLTAARVHQLRRNATRLKKASVDEGLTHRQALNIVAVAEGFKDWRDLEAQSRAATPPSRSDSSSRSPRMDVAQKELEARDVEDAFKDWTAATSLAEDVAVGGLEMPRRELARRPLGADFPLCGDTHSALAARLHHRECAATKCYLSGYRTSSTNSRWDA